MSTTADKFENHLRTRTPEEAPPDVLYKYMTCETARKVLYNQTLRFNSPRHFNDPFDSQWNFYWPLSSHEAKQDQFTILYEAIHDPDSWPDGISEHSAKMLRTFRRRLADKPPDEVRSELNYLLFHTFSNENLERMIRPAMEKVVTRSRILCLTANPCSTLMWSHYAASHSGVAIGLRSDAVEHLVRIPIQRVQYVDELPVLIDAQDHFKAALFGTRPPALLGRGQQWALVKHRHWQYEEEWRSASVVDGSTALHSDHPLKQETLLQLIAGSRTDPAEFDYLLHLARKINGGVQCFKMLPHQREFRMVKGPYVSRPPGA